MPTPANHTVKAGSALGSALEFFTLTATGVDLLTNKAILNAVIETISLKAQPVIIDIENATTLKFAVEHVMVLVAADLQTQVAATILEVTTSAVPSVPVTSTVVVTKAIGL